MCVLSGIPESNWRLLLGREIYYRYTNPAVSGYCTIQPQDFVPRPGGGMVDAKDLKSFGRKAVWVRVPPGAQ